MTVLLFVGSALNGLLVGYLTSGRGWRRTLGCAVLNTLSLAMIIVGAPHA